MKVALVTGASRGLGADICRRLSEDGWSIAVNYSRDTESANKVVSNIASSGGRAVLAQFDVTDEASVANGIARIAANIGPVDLIVNNATGPQPEFPLMEQSWSAYMDQLLFFVKAPLILLQAVLPDWRARKSGRVINIGSEIAELGNPYFGNYAAAKGAMLSMTRSWANELGPENITVNLVAPGWIPVERHGDVEKSALESYGSQVPLGYLGKPRTISDAVAFLASDQADFITGQKIAVNGGRTFL